MKVNAIVLVSVLVTTSFLLAQEAPWNDKGTFSCWTYTQGGSQWTPMDPSYWYDYYDVNYGEIPNAIRYEDLNDTVKVKIYIGFVYKPYYLYEALPQDSTWWQDSFTWGELRQHLGAYLLNTSTSQVQELQLPSSNLNEQLESKHTGSYEIKFEYDLSQLPVNEQNVIYKIWVEPITQPLPTYLDIDTLSVFRTVRSVPADTLFWMYRNWYDAVESDPNLPARMLVHYPNDTRLLRTQFWRYYDAVNCDSVSHYGQRLVQVWQSDSSMYMMDHLSNFDMHQAIQDVEERIKHICIDGQPQPKTALGWSEI
ncbi:hypothetical protein KQI52_13215 [bacterium]|nr:hypothetical protein [bacterium]